MAALWLFSGISLHILVCILLNCLIWWVGVLLCNNDTTQSLFSKKDGRPSVLSAGYSATPHECTTVVVKKKVWRRQGIIMIHPLEEMELALKWVLNM